MIENGIEGSALRQAQTASTDSDAVISARGLTRRFGHFVAVDHVDVDVRAAEVFGLLGANGAGKTTTIRMLCGLLAPSGGTIQVAGIDMVHRARRARGRIGYVAQGFALYADLTVAENLALQAGLYGLTGKHRDSRLAWAIARMELSGQERERAGELPLGFRRRLSLAAALLHAPRVLFLDEPTSGVDPLARQRFWELIYDLADTGIGLLVTTHYMDEALFCDRLALMHAGKIVQQGTPDELLARPLATPILELRTPDYVKYARLLRAWPEIQELIPRAGLLRIHLHAGADAAAVSCKLKEAAASHHIAISKLELAPPELEDTFVAVLAEQGPST